VTKRILAKFGLSAAMAIAVAGCDSGDRQATHTPPADQPAKVNPPTTLPATKPVAQVTPGESYLWLREVPDPRKSQADAAQPADPDEVGAAVKFPRARLKLTSKGESHLVALLYSDDPKEALKANWQGDRYYFRMPLQISDPKAIDGQPYRMAVGVDDSDETSNGVFLRGDRTHLEPIDLSVRFEQQGAQVVVYIGGLFKQQDTTDVNVEPRWFHLQGIVQTAVE
jgi:hypothetical protein